MGRRTISILMVALLAGALATPAVSAGTGGAQRGSPSRSAAVMARGRYLRSHGYLPLHPLAYARAKAAADRAANAGPAPGSSSSVGGVLAPVAGPAWQGLHQSNLAPPDTTGAAGPTRYIELINLQFGIYGRTGSLINRGKLSSLTGHPQNALTDPQIMWDPGTQRFYFVVLDFADDTMAWGFSKSDSPSGAPDFCAYTADFGYGTDLPDYPKLGDTKDFLLIGVNVFRGFNTYLGSDVDWVTKPSGTGTITTCPAQGSFKLGKVAKLRDKNGRLVNTPSPAGQVDVSATGWVVAVPDLTVVSRGRAISVFEVTKDSTSGAAKVTLAGSVAVSAFELPPSAPQKQTSARIDTLDGRLEHAVSATDPRFGKTAVWTAHAVKGGAGDEERWYEIDPVGLTLLQSGAATSQSLYVYNGAIAPDRVVSASGSGFGSAMVMGFNTSSSQDFPAIQMVSKIGGGAQSGFVLVKQSSGANIDFSCGVCRWGDYSGATSDPSPSLLGGAKGRVWLSNQWDIAGSDSSDVDWRTWNWQATP
jgi:hypothetical protein